METLLGIGLSNALAAAVLAMPVALFARLLRSRRPALAHGLWLLVLLKLITPPLFTVPVPWPAEEPSETSKSASSSGWLGRSLRRPGALTARLSRGVAGLRPSHPGIGEARWARRKRVPFTA